MTPARKAQTLRMMAMWLGTSKDFGRFDNYGCHCLADVSKGYGMPVDATDRSCKALQQCYECAKLGTSNAPAIETCNPATAKYKFQLRVKIDTDTRTIRCCKSCFLLNNHLAIDDSEHKFSVDKKDDCLRRACECDIRFAESMAMAENTWDVNFHTERNGGSWKYNEQTRFLTLESRGPNA